MASPRTVITETPASPKQRVSDLSSSSDSSSREHEIHHGIDTNPHHRHHIQAPVPVRPRLLSRKSSGPMVIPRDGDVGPVDIQFGPDDVRAMSPRRTSEDIEEMGREAREELRRQAKMLQESLLAMLQRIDHVREEHDKLDSNNRFLQKYIGDLMSTSKITATGDGRSKK